MTNLIAFHHRTLTVFLLSLISMVACFLWWGKLPVGLLQVETTESKTKSFRPAWAPPYLFQSNWNSADDDDETEFTGDDDNYLQGERVRGSESDTQLRTKHQQSKSNRTKTSLASDSSNTTKQNYSFENYKSRPKMVWLMSYPNSGTSYTMTMVSRASNRAIASNYGREVTVPPKPNTPLYPGEEWSWNGPFYKPNPRKPLPQDYILVKTHCGGRCVLCGPEGYVTDEQSFLDECRRGSGLFPADVRQRLMEDDTSASGSSDGSATFTPDGFLQVHYNASLVQKAIHLYRSPFNNIVSRFHLERKHWVDAKKKEEVERYSNDAAGFQKWCLDLNKGYGPKPSDKQKYISKDLVEIMQDVPCHGEFYKYTQWHNLADAVATHSQKQTLIIHYENYDQKWNETATKILDFLHLDMQGTPKDFHAGHDYDPYFTSRQRRAAKLMVELLATEPVWRQIERYF